MALAQTENNQHQNKAAGGGVSGRKGEEGTGLDVYISPAPCSPATSNYLPFLDFNLLLCACVRVCVCVCVCVWGRGSSLHTWSLHRTISNLKADILP